MKKRGETVDKYPEGVYNKDTIIPGRGMEKELVYGRDL